MVNALCYIRKRLGRSTPSRSLDSSTDKECVFDDRNFDFEELVAKALHDDWRRARGKDPVTGKYTPRIKELGGKSYDIANLEFKQLPEYYRFENLIAAKIVTMSLRNAFELCKLRKDFPDFNDYVARSEFVEEASALQHMRWVERNKDKGWVSEAQLLPYVELSEVEKDKDRLIVRAAIEVLQSYQATTRGEGKQKS